MTSQRRDRGELEAHVLRVLWDEGTELTAKEVRDRVSGATPAHTTVLTALDRLVGKGVVQRSGARSRNICFRAVLSEDEYISRAMLNRLSSSSDRHAALMRFAGTLEDDDLDVLRRAVEERKAP